MIDYRMVQILKGYPELVSRYQGVPSTVPVLLQPVGVPPTFPSGRANFPMATFASVQLGARLQVALPIMVSDDNNPAPVTSYRYRPIWRLRSANARPPGHLLPILVPSPVPQGLTGDFIPAFTTGQDLIPAQTTIATLPAGPVANTTMLFEQGSRQNPGSGVPPYVALPWVLYEFTAVGDEFGLIVVPEVQQFDSPVAARTWDFDAGAADANFGYFYATSPVAPESYQLGIGALVITGERSP